VGRLPSTGDSPITLKKAVSISRDETETAGPSPERMLVVGSYAVRPESAVVILRNSSSGSLRT